MSKLGCHDLSGQFLVLQRDVITTKISPCFFLVLTADILRY